VAPGYAQHVVGRDADGAGYLFAALNFGVDKAGEVNQDILVPDRGDAPLAGLDASRFSGHSLRRGLLTAAGDLQLPLIDLLRQSRHRSVATALTYVEAGDAWRNNITEPAFGGGLGR
jgi:hypothetical protein